MRRGKLILLDSDVLIHFFKANELRNIHKIFPGRLCILDTVLNEVGKRPAFRLIIQGMIDKGHIQLVKFPSNPDILLEYARLLKTKGKGESACLAVARNLVYAIGSSNLKDIRLYCERHGIEYITTMDFLVEAFTIGVFTEEDCDSFIYAVLSAGSKLPCNTIQDYLGLKTST